MATEREAGRRVLPILFLLLLCLVPRVAFGQSNGPTAEPPAPVGGDAEDDGSPSAQGALTGTAQVEPTRISESLDYSEMSDAELRSERHRLGLGGPIALISVGSVLSVIGTLAVVAGAASQGICAGFSSSCSSNSGILAVGGLTLGAGVVLGVSGGVWLGDRIPKRQAIDEELRARGRLARARIGLLPAPLGTQLGVIGTF